MALSCQRRSIAQWCLATLTFWPAFPLSLSHFCTNGRWLSISPARLTDQGPVLGVPGHTSVPIFDSVSLLCSPESLAVSAQRDSALQVRYKNNNRGASFHPPQRRGLDCSISILNCGHANSLSGRCGEWAFIYLLWTCKGMVHPKLKFCHYLLPSSCSVDGDQELFIIFHVFLSDSSVWW